MTADECALHDCSNAVEADEAWCLGCRETLCKAGQQVMGQGGFR
jgi:hypothetical protein